VSWAFTGQHGPARTSVMFCRLSHVHPALAAQSVSLRIRCWDGPHAGAHGVHGEYSHSVVQHSVCSDRASCFFFSDVTVQPQPLASSSGHVWDDSVPMGACGVSRRHVLWVLWVLRVLRVLRCASRPGQVAMHWTVGWGGAGAAKAAWRGAGS